MNEPRSDAASQPPAASHTGLPPGRYDGAEAGSSVAGKLIAILLVVLVAALLAATAFTLYRLNATPDISGEEIAMEVLDDQHATVIFTVTRDEPEAPAYCIVRTLDQGKGELGRREVYVPPSESTTVRVEATVVSAVRPFTGDIYGCGADVPEYLRR